MTRAIPCTKPALGSAPDVDHILVGKAAPAASAADRAPRPDAPHQSPHLTAFLTRGDRGGLAPATYVPRSIQASKTFPRPMSATGAMTGPFETDAFRARAIAQLPLPTLPS